MWWQGDAGGRHIVLSSPCAIKGPHTNGGAKCTREECATWGVHIIQETEATPPGPLDAGHNAHAHALGAGILQVDLLWRKR